MYPLISFWAHSFTFTSFLLAYLLFSPFMLCCTPLLPFITFASTIRLVCRVWEVKTGEVLNTLIHHNEAVLHLRFANGLMVTCSKDRSIAVWDMASPTDISLRRVLVGHRAAVNVVDFDDKYIVSASGDRTIKVREIHKNTSSSFKTFSIVPNQGATYFLLASVITLSYWAQVLKDFCHLSNIMDVNCTCSNTFKGSTTLPLLRSNDSVTQGAAWSTRCKSALWWGASNWSWLFSLLTSGPVISIKLMRWVKSSFCAAVSFTLVKTENCSCIKLPTSSQLSFSSIIFEQRQTLRADIPKMKSRAGHKSNILDIVENCCLIIMCLQEYLQAAVNQTFFCLALFRYGALAHVNLCAH